MIYLGLNISYKNKMKRIFSILLCITCLIGLSPNVSAVQTAAITNNVALNKPITSLSSLSADTDAKYAVDGNYSTIWSVGTRFSVPWIQIDLLESTALETANVYFRNDADQPETRYGVEILGSNDSNFTEYSVLASSGNEQFPRGGVWNAEIIDKTAYRYIRVRRTLNEYSVFAEIELYPYIPQNTGFLDLKGKTNEFAMRVCDALGIMESEDSEKFEPERPVTRAEAAKQVISLMGYGAMDNDCPFVDVQQDNSYTPYISAAYNLGIISGDGNGKFEPGRYITNLELNTMILSALGYDFMLGKKTPAEVVKTAKYLEYDFSNPDEIVTRAEAAQRYYEAMYIKRYSAHMISDKKADYLEESCIAEKKNISVFEGVVMNNEITTLSGANMPSDGFLVGDVICRDKSGNLAQELGYNVKVMVDDENNVLAFAKEDNEVMTIRADMLNVTQDELSSGKISYYNEKDSKKSVKITRQTDVFYNGDLYLDYTASEFDITQGEVTLVDNDSDGTYDVVFIKSADILVVSFAHIDEEEVTILTRNGRDITFKAEAGKKFIAKDETGKNVTALDVDDVLEVYQSKSGNYIEIIACDTRVEGTVTKIVEKDERIATVDGSDYVLLDTVSASNEKIEINKKATFLITASGKIAWILPFVPSQIQQGFITKFAVDGSFNENVRIRIFNKNGIFANYFLAERVKVDGVPMTKKEIIDRPELLRPQLAEYKLNSNNEIFTIDTEAIGTDDLFKAGRLIDTGSFNYIFNNTILGDGKMLVGIDGNTTVYTIPVLESGDYAIGSQFERYYKVGNATKSYWGGGGYSGAFTVYNMDEYRYADTIMVKKTVHADASLGDFYEAVPDTVGTVMLVDEVEYGIDSEDNQITRLIGYNVISGVKTSVLLKAENLFLDIYKIRQNGLGDLLDAYSQVISYTDIPQEYFACTDSIVKGDIVRYSAEGEVASIFERLFSIAEKPVVTPNSNAYWWASMNNFTHIFAELRLMYGYVYRLDGTTVGVGAAEVNPGVYDDEVYNLKDAKVFVYDAERGIICTGGLSDLHNLNDNSRIMLIQTSAKPRTVVVYDDYLK